MIAIACIATITTIVLVVAKNNFWFIPLIVAAFLIILCVPTYSIYLYKYLYLDGLDKINQSISSIKLEMPTIRERIKPVFEKEVTNDLLSEKIIHDGKNHNLINLFDSVRVTEIKNDVAKQIGIGAFVEISLDNGSVIVKSSRGILGKITETKTEKSIQMSVDSGQHILARIKSTQPLSLAIGIYQEE